MIPWNHLALIISILANVTPDVAFHYLRTGKFPTVNRFSEEDVAEMIRLKETMSYREIGELFGVSDDTIRNWIRRYPGAVA